MPKHFLPAPPGPLSIFLHPALERLNSSDYYPDSLAPLASSGLGQWEAQVRDWWVGRERSGDSFPPAKPCSGSGCGLLPNATTPVKLLSSLRVRTLSRAASHPLPLRLQAERLHGFSTVFILVVLSISSHSFANCPFMKSPLAYLFIMDQSRCGLTLLGTPQFGAGSEPYFTSPSFLLGPQSPSPSPTGSPPNSFLFTGILWKVINVSLSSGLEILQCKYGFWEERSLIVIILAVNKLIRLIGERACDLLAII